MSKSTSNNRQCKKVRFSDDNETFGYEAIPKVAVAELFWSREEQEATYDRQVLAAERLLDSQPELVDNIYCLHGFDLKNKCKFDTKEESHTTDLNAATCQLAFSNCRGLESLLTSLMGDHQLLTIDKILSVQDQYYEQSQEMQESQDLSEVLRLWSSSMSELSRKFAQLVAQGDAVAACAIYAERGHFPQRQLPSHVEADSICMSQDKSASSSRKKVAAAA